MVKIFNPFFTVLVLFALVSGPGCSGKKTYTLKDITFVQFYDPT